MASGLTRKMERVSMCGHGRNVEKPLNTKTWGTLTNSLLKLKSKLILQIHYTIELDINVINWC